MKNSTTSWEGESVDYSGIRFFHYVRFSDVNFICVKTVILVSCVLFVQCNYFTKCALYILYILYSPIRYTESTHNPSTFIRYHSISFHISVKISRTENHHMLCFSVAAYTIRDFSGQLWIFRQDCNKFISKVFGNELRSKTLFCSAVVRDCRLLIVLSH